MAVFVILALTILAVAVGAVAVAALQVAQVARRGRTVVETTRDQLRPLAGELQDELAVMSTEADAVGERVSALAAARRGRRNGRRKGRSR